MLSLILAVLLAAGLAHVMRHAQGRGRDMAWVGAVNYFVAAALSLAVWRIAFRTPLGRPEVVYGCLGGVTWFCAYLLLNASIRLAGVSITQCVGWLGVAVPVAVSAFLWNEAPDRSQYAGLAFMAVALGLLTPGKTSNVARKSRWKVPALLGLLAAEGVINVVMKAFCEALKARGLSPAQADERIPCALIFMFAVAGAGVLIVALVRSPGAWKASVPHGVALGVCSFAANLTFIMAISRLSGPIVFPTYWAGTILVTATASMLLWKERYPPRVFIGMALAAVGMVFVNVNLLG